MKISHATNQPSNQLTGINQQNDKTQFINYTFLKCNCVESIEIYSFGCELHIDFVLFVFLAHNKTFFSFHEIEIYHR